MTAPRLDRPAEPLRDRLRWLLGRLLGSEPSGARMHPDGGPGPHSGPYPWEGGPVRGLESDVAWVDELGTWHPPEFEGSFSVEVRPHPVRHPAVEVGGFSDPQLDANGNPALLPGDPGYWGQFDMEAW